MKVAIIDPGYDHPHSHHQGVNIGLADALADSGIESTIVASRQLEDSLRGLWTQKGIPVAPFFETPTYPPNVEKLELAEHMELARRFGRELVNAVHEGVVPRGAWLIFHTAYAFHVSGVAQALYRLPAGAIGGVYFSLMFDPGAKSAAQQGAGTAQVFESGRYLKYRNAFKLLSAVADERAVPLCVETSCASYQQAFRRAAPDLQIGLHPIVTYSGELHCDRKPEPNTVLMYLGGPKEDKGIRFALAVTERLITEHPDLKLLFHYNSGFPGAGQFAAEVERLKDAGGDLEVIEGNLEPEEYDALVCRSATMCVLYNPAHYGFKTSGVLWDGFRRPDMRWVVSAGTWMADELEQTGFEHMAVTYGEVEEAADAIAEFVRRNPQRRMRSPAQIEYSRRLLSRFGDHVAARMKGLEGRPVPHGAGARRGDERILVVRTQYGHFGALSGPGGFIGPLREKVALVDELLVPLGEGELVLDNREGLSSLWSAARGYLNSYQLNSVLVEQRLLEVDWEKYDIVHFLDGEHSGLLTALAAAADRDWSYPDRPRFIGTFHQPESVLHELVKDPSFLAGFDLIHVLSPCQERYFRKHTAANVVCVAHGIAPKLIETYSAAETTLTARRERMALTTGNWLRDFESLVETARLLEGRTDLQFVVVSKGLELSGPLPANLTLLNQGISDEELHALYECAELLFLPLLDGAANNAMLEAMAHGLPIVTTDLPSTRYYTGGQALFCDRSPEVYAQKLMEAVGSPQFASPAALKARAQELSWPNIADEMLAKLYRTTVNC